MHTATIFLTIKNVEVYVALLTCKVYRTYQNMGYIKPVCINLKASKPHAKLLKDKITAVIVILLLRFVLHEEMKSQMSTFPLTHHGW